MPVGMLALRRRFSSSFDLVRTKLLFDRQVKSSRRQGDDELFRDVENLELDEISAVAPLLDGHSKRRLAYSKRVLEKCAGHADRLRLAKALADADMAFYAIVKAGDEDSKVSRRTFRKISPRGLVDFIVVFGMVKKVPKTFHRYYLFYKFHELLDDIDFADLPVVLRALEKHGVFNPPNHPLDDSLCRRLLRRVRNEASAETMNVVRHVFESRISRSTFGQRRDEFFFLEDVFTKLSAEFRLKDVLVIGRTFARSEESPDSYIEILRHRLRTDDIEDVISVLAATHMLKSACWLPDDLKRLIFAKASKFLLVKDALETRRERFVATLFTVVSAYRDFFDPKLASSIFSNASIVCDVAEISRKTLIRAYDDRKGFIVRPAIRFSDDRHDQLTARYVELLAHRVQGDRDYVGQMILPFRFTKHSNGKDEESLYGIELFLRRLCLELRKRKMRFFEANLFPYLGSTDFVFDLDDVPLDDNGLATLPEGAQCRCLSVVDSRQKGSSVIPNFHKMLERNYKSIVGLESVIVVCGSSVLEEASEFKKLNESMSKLVDLASNEDDDFVFLRDIDLK